MVDDAIKTGTPSAASPAAEEAARDAAMLSGLATLAEAMAAGFQAQGMAALQAGDLDRAGEAETRFSSLFLGIRRAIALKMKLRRQREETQREAGQDRDLRRDQKDDRRQAVADRVSRAIAKAKPAARERLTAGLWEKLTEDERIDADLADTALPIEALIRRLCREIGLSRHALAAALDPDLATAEPAAGPAAAAPASPAQPDPRYSRYTNGHYHVVPAADLGLPEGDTYLVNITTGEVFQSSTGDVVKRLPMDDRPPDSARSAPQASSAPPAEAAPPDPGGTGPAAAPASPEPRPPPAAAVPPFGRALPSDWRTWTRADWLENRRRLREEQLRLHASKPHPF